MAKLRVLAEKPPMPQGTPDNQLRELRDYLFRVHEELEYLLTNLGEDNLDRVLRGYVKQIEVNAGEIETLQGGWEQTTLFSDTAIDVQPGTSSVPVKVTLADNARNYKLLAVCLHNALTTGSRRGVVMLSPRFAQLQADYPIASNGTVGFVRIGVDPGEPDKLQFYNTSFTTALYCVRVFGYR
jgi:hypothetical protein